MKSTVKIWGLTDEKIDCIPSMSKFCYMLNFDQPILVHNTMMIPISILESDIIYHFCKSHSAVFCSVLSCAPPHAHLINIY